MTTLNKVAILSWKIFEARAEDIMESSSYLKINIPLPQENTSNRRSEQQVPRQCRTFIISMINNLYT